MEHPSIIFKIVCPDRPGLVSLLTSWISNYGGNIKHSDHHTDQDAGLFLSRIEWSSKNATFDRDEIYKEFEKIADEVNGKFNVNYSDEIPNVAIFVSKQNHCLIFLFLLFLFVNDLLFYFLDIYLMFEVTTRHLFFHL